VAGPDASPLLERRERVRARALHAGQLLFDGQQPPTGISCWRPLLTAAAFAFLDHRLRRYLAPTVVVDARPVRTPG
jgi:hypothetical protein